MCLLAKLLCAKFKHSLNNPDAVVEVICLDDDVIVLVGERLYINIADDHNFCFVSDIDAVAF